MADPLDTIYSGPKAHLRVLHERLMAEISKLGAHEKAAKKNLHQPAPQKTICHARAGHQRPA